MMSVEHGKTNGKDDMKLLYILISLLIVLVVVSLLSYAMAPDSDSFQWAAFNPMEAVASIMFMLSFGFGLPEWLSLMVIITFLLMLWYGFYMVLRRIFVSGGTNSDDEEQQ